MAKNNTYRALHVVDVENEIMSGTFGLQDVELLYRFRRSQDPAKGKGAY